MYTDGFHTHGLLVKSLAPLAHYSTDYPLEGQPRMVRLDGSPPWGPFCLYSLDKIQLLRMMSSCFSQLEFPVVSGQHYIKISLVHMSSCFNTFFIWNQTSAFYLVHVEPNLWACLIFTWPEKLYPFLSEIYLVLVSYLIEPTGTYVNVTCPVSSTLSWSAEFKWTYQHLKIKAIA
jgi:hypothetical protein